MKSLDKISFRHSAWGSYLTYIYIYMYIYRERDLDLDRDR